MRTIFGLVLVVGIALAGAAVYMARGLLSQNAAALARAKQNAVQTVPVYVAIKTLSYGDVLTKADVGKIAWQANAVPPTAFTDLNKLFPNGATETRVVMRQVDQYEPILSTAVTEPGQDAGITSRLSAGNRAFTVRVDGANSISGFLRPEDRVDIYWTGRSTLSPAEVTKLIEPGMRVIAIDQSINPPVVDAKAKAPAQPPRTVTVEATPQQVAILAQAQATGRLSMSLVGLQDSKMASAVEVDSNRLLGIEAKAPVAAAPKQQVCTIRQRTGMKVIEVPIPCTN
ncbi:MAG: Flp pilus assembly protein CpaB [Paracoccaceae bacterium]|nr:Flp pilus assembly protein CpaB [Paracoccaceae bacterium]